MTTPEEYIIDKLSKFAGVISYDDFTNLATSVAHVYDIPLKDATELIHKFRGKLEIGSQEFQNQGFGPNNLWDGQDRALNFGQNAPGDLAEPKSSLLPLSRIELVAFKVGDIVRVVKNDQAPWGGEYKGIIERINAQNSFDIRDLSTGVLNTSQPARLLRNPLGEGRPDVRIQQRRVGDPKGMGEGQLDSGDPNIKREMPGMYMMPRGQEGKDIKNPQSLFYKEAQVGDELHAFLLSSILKEYGTASAQEVTHYLNGNILTPSRSLRSIIHKYNLIATNESVSFADHFWIQLNLKEYEWLDPSTATAHGFGSSSLDAALKKLSNFDKEMPGWQSQMKARIVEFVDGDPTKARVVWPAELTKSAHCGPCLPIKLEVIRMLSDMHFELNNFDKKYLGALGAQSEEASSDHFTNTLNEVLSKIAPTTEIVGKLRKLRQISITLQEIQHHVDDGEFKADKPKA